MTDPTDDDLASIGGGARPFPSATERPFRPWHRPRKHYVRHKQWARDVSWVFDGSKNAEFRYLTLPGPDMLDVRHLHDTVCRRNQLELRFLGFDTGARGQEFHRIPDSVDATRSDEPSGDDEDVPERGTAFALTRLDRINRDSRLAAYDFRDIGDERSVAFEWLRQMRSFHAINLDLCGSLTHVGEVTSHFRALKWLLQQQSAADHRFALFITARLDTGLADADGTLAELVSRFAEGCDDFAEWVDTYSDGTVETSTVRLALWLLTNARYHGLDVSLSSVATYRTGDGTVDGPDDIASLTFRFSPAPRLQPDPALLVSSGRDDSLDCDAAAGIAAEIATPVRLDHLLRADEDAFSKAYAGSRDLLGRCGYDEDAYQSWVLEEAHRYPDNVRELCA